MGVTVTLLGVGVARAQPARRFHRARLVWQVDASAARCAREDAFRQEVARRLGASPFDPEAPTTVTVAVSTTGAALEGRVQTSTAAGSPLRVPLSACGELVTLLAGRTAVFLEDDAPPELPDASSPPVDAGVDAPPPGPPPPEVMRPPPVAVSPPPRQRAWGLVLGLAPTFTVLGEPASVALGLSASLRARVGAFSFGLELSGALPIDGTKDTDGVTLRPIPLRGVVMACAHPWRLGLCALGGVAVNLVSVVDRLANHADTVVFTQAAAGARVEAGLWQSRRVGVGAYVDVLALPAPAVVRLPEGVAWRLGWTLSLGIDARFTIL
ncbi:MAG: hypothetical protein U0325_33770 [Polyangiales bacterium]